MNDHPEHPQPGESPEEQLRRMLRDLLGEDIDPEALASVAGLPAQNPMMQEMMRQLQQALSGAQARGGGIDWSVAGTQAQRVASAKQVPISARERTDVDEAFRMAALWLGEVTDFADPAQQGTVMNRTEWARDSMPFWQEVAEPIANGISEALFNALSEQLPDDAGAMLAGAKQMINGVGGTLFAMQLGQVVGELSTEVLSATDIGVPVLDEHTCALLPQNVVSFGEGLGVPAEEVRIYLATRELAHHALFRRARWLSLDLVSAVKEFARGTTIDVARMEDIAERFNPSNPEQLQQALRDGSLIPPKSEQQQAALQRIETLLAVVEGWVDVVTAKATARLPSAGALAEMYNRRRATGGPAEAAFGSLIGLELRPRRLREAAAMWRRVDEALSPADRDALWAHPDIVPTAADIDDPDALVARLTGPAPQPSDLDRELERLLSGEFDERPPTDGPADGSEGGDGA